jgi:hypothetical protein
LLEHYSKDSALENHFVHGEYQMDVTSDGQEGQVILIERWEFCCQDYLDVDRKVNDDLPNLQKAGDDLDFVEVRVEVERCKQEHGLYFG